MDALRPLSLDQFAQMTAEMEVGFARDQVLAGASVSPEQWDLTQETWLLRMAKQGAQRKLALLDRYNELLAKHRKAAQRKMRVEKRKLKGPVPAPAEAHLSPLVRARDDGAGATFQKPGFGEPAERAAFAAPVAPAPLPVAPAPLPVVDAPPVAGPAWLTPPAQVPPSVPPAAPEPEPVPAASPTMSGPAWLQAQRPSAPSPSPPSERPPAAPVAGPAWLSGKAAPRADEPLPGRPSSPAIPPARPAAPVESETRPGGGLSLSAAERASWISALDRPAESPSVPAEPAPPRPAPSAAEARRLFGGTASVDETGGPSPSPIVGPAWMKAPQASKDDGQARAASMEALPFQRSNTGLPPPVPPPRPSRPPVPPPRPSRPPVPQAAAAEPIQPAAAASVEETGGPAPSPIAGPAWMKAAQASKEAPARATSMDALPFQQGPREAPARATSMDALPFQRANTGAPAPASQPAQPPQPAPPPAPRLSLEQLAWLQAQVEVSPDMGRAAREQLGMSEADHTAERAYWQARFQQDRPSVERYSQLFYHYRRAR